MPSHVLRPSVGARLAAVLLVAFASVVTAQDPSPTDPPPPVRRALEARLEALDQIEGLDAESKERAAGLLQNALAALDLADGYATQRVAFEAAVVSAADTVAALRQKTEAATKTAADPGAPLTAADATELTTLLQQDRSEAASAKAELDRLDAELQRLEARPRAAREELAGANADAAEAERALRQPPAAGEAVAVSEAQRLALAAQRHAARARADMLEQDLLSQPARVQVATAERTLQTQVVAALSVRVTSREEMLLEQQRREAEAAQRAAEAAQRAAQGQHPVVAAVAEENAATTGEIAGAAADHEPATRARRWAEGELARLKETHARTRAQLERAGLAGFGGELMRDQRQQLPRTLAVSQAAQLEWRTRIATAEARQFELYLELRDLVDLDLAANSRLDRAEGDPPVTGLGRSAAIERLRELLAARRNLLSQLEDSIRVSLETLRELDAAHTQLQDEALAFAELLDEWLLWIPSAPALAGAGLQAAVGSLAGLGATAAWSSVVRGLGSRLLHHWPVTVVMVLVLLALMRARAPARRRLGEIATAVRRVSSDSFGLTVEALALTAVLAAAWPIFLAFLSWQLAAVDGAAPVAAAFGWVAVVATGLALVRHLCAERGVGEQHLRWRTGATALLRRELRWARWPTVVSVFVVALCNAQGDAALRDGVGRVAFILAMLIAAVFLFRVAHPGGSWLQPILARDPRGWLSRLRYLWFPVTVALPVALAIVAGAGYYYAALQLDRCFTATLGLVIGLLVLRGLAHRWLLIEQRRLAVAQFLAQREAKEDRAGEEGEVPVADELEIDLSAINDQSRQLLKTTTLLGGLLGVWLIWSSVLPAFGVLDQVRLWSSATAEVAGAVEVTDWTTLQDLVAALLALLLTVTAGRNLPGLLQIVVLKNLPIDSGTRYAIVTVARYVLFIIGLSVVLQIIGFGWSRLQWLVAALGVGIGFGLQEIIANFVCGLILLFERPIRIGDLVTIGGTTGKVSRIRIRATTITNWDRQELVIPNKELIIGRVLNWTLTGTVNRVVITVGVGYGSDTEKARDLLLRIAQDHPLVLEDPGPMATFEQFGDSALQLVLRCYLADFENRLGTIHELHTAIHRGCAAAGIEIAFPQLDVHVQPAPAPIPAPTGRDR
ncbi:MAG: mechanosensitive ion channel domain-containing protein [Planctomycetota bacterium]